MCIVQARHNGEVTLQISVEPPLAIGGESQFAHGHSVYDRYRQTPDSGAEFHVEHRAVYNPSQRVGAIHHDYRNAGFGGPFHYLYHCYMICVEPHSYILQVDGYGIDSIKSALWEPRAPSGI